MSELSLADQRQLVLPQGSTVGILGGGQLGMMLAESAKRHGYRTVVRTDDAPGGPASRIANAEICAPYDDDEANQRFISQVHVVTAEFENLPESLLNWIAQRKPMRPNPQAIVTCQHRQREKEFLAANSIPHAPFRVITSAAECETAFKGLGPRAILKSAAFGYDGRGQIRLDANDSARSDASAAWIALDVPAAVMEQFVPFVSELSIVGARSQSGDWVAFEANANVHVNGILDTTTSPANVAAEVAQHAEAIARTIADKLDYIGTLAVEFFVLADDTLVVNEIAPRPHNSGHHTIDSCASSQFDLQLRATVGLDLGDFTQHSPAVMHNLLGDLWADGKPDWATMTSQPGAHLHLYGKSDPRPGRKMGHLTVLAKGKPPLDDGERAI
jgi:5-(carboxyamino)imidazole ribonucleotide synthase